MSKQEQMTDNIMEGLITGDITPEDALKEVVKVMVKATKNKCERYLTCGNYVEGNGWGMNHNYCSFECKRKDEDWL